jgi:ABC-2 type transport system ATP-binding protein
VSIIRQGRTVETGTLAELRHLTRTSITVDLAQTPDSLATLPGVHEFHADGTHVHCQADTDQLDAVLRQLSALGVRNLVCRPPTLEELFLRHYGVAS